MTTSTVEQSVDERREERDRTSHQTDSFAAMHLPPPSADGNDLKVWIVDDLEEVGDLERIWNRLLSPKSSPFSTFDWNFAWYRAFADAYDEIQVLVTTLEDSVEAILPCYRKGRTLRLAGDLTCDYQDLVAIDETKGAASLQAIFRWLLAEKPEYEFYLEKISTRGILGKLLNQSGTVHSGVLKCSRPLVPCPWVALPESCERYLHSLPQKSRSEFRRVMNRLDRKLPGAVIEVMDGDTIVGENLDRAAKFHAEHFRKEGNSPLADPRLVELMESVAESEAVGLRVSWLRDGDALLAVDFAFCRGGTFYGYLTDFDTKYRKLSPGRCLFIKRIDHWIQNEGIDTLDLLGGGENYKKGYTEGARYGVSTIRIFPKNAGNWLRWALLQTKGRMHAVAKLFLERRKISKGAAT